VVAAILGAIFLAWSLYGLRRESGRAWARGVFLGSIAYLTLLFTALAVSAG
jgi:heme O synthase-like polyprenyltransferase